jgi:hypothetical protein
LFDVLNGCVLPHARRAGDQQLFRDEIMPSADVQGALAECRADLSTWYELVSEGADFLSLEQWLRAIDSRQLLTDLTVKGHAVRLTEPQARQAFFLAAKTPTEGLLPNELATCVVKTACDKYRHIETLANGMRFTNGHKVRAFVANMLGVADEEDVLADVTPAKGYTPPAAAAGQRKEGGARRSSPTPAPAPAPARRAPAPAPAAVSHGGGAASGADTAAAAAALEQLLPPDFYDSLDDGSGKAHYAIADVVEELAERQEALRQGLKKEHGVILFAALDRVRGDGNVPRTGLREALGHAVASEPALLEMFLKAVKQVAIS